MLQTILWLGAVMGLLGVGYPLALNWPRCAFALVPVLAATCFKFARTWAAFVTRISTPLILSTVPARRPAVVLSASYPRRRRVLTTRDLCAG